MGLWELIVARNRERRKTRQNSQDEHLQGISPLSCGKNKGQHFWCFLGSPYQSKFFSKTLVSQKYDGPQEYLHSGVAKK